MDSPNKKQYALANSNPEFEYDKALNSYIDYLELRVNALTIGLNDIVITLKNMQRDGKDDK